MANLISAVLGTVAMNGVLSFMGMANEDIMICTYSLRVRFPL